MNRGTLLYWTGGSCKKLDSKQRIQSTKFTQSISSAIHQDNLIATLQVEKTLCPLLKWKICDFPYVTQQKNTGLPLIWFLKALGIFYTLYEKWKTHTVLWQFFKNAQAISGQWWVIWGHFIITSSYIVNSFEGSLEDYFHSDGFLLPL